MKKSFAAIILSTALQINCYSQISINGPGCALAGGSNGVLYSLSGQWQPSDMVSWSVIGGIISSTNKNSISGTISTLNQIRVIWNSNAKSGNIQITNSRLGSANLNVSVVTISNQISVTDTSAKFGSSLMINGAAPDVICNCSFSSWWESSTNSSGPFLPITGGVDQNLSIDSATKNLFYRRVISINGDNIYSNVILISISPGSSSTIKINNHERRHELWSGRIERKLLELC